MRFGVAVLFLLVGCSSREAPGETALAPKVNATAATATDSAMDSPSVNTSRSDSPRAAVPIEGSYDAFDRYRLNPFPPPPSCPFPASTCSPPCVPVTGTRIDNANQCLSSAVVVGCLHGDTQLNTDAACFKRSQDGVLLGTSSSLRDTLGADWESCTRDEAAVLFNHSVCP